MGSVTATNVGLFDLSTPLSNGASAASSPASEKASQAVQGFDIIEISARALELQAAGFDLSTALPNSTSAQLPAGTSSAIDKAPQQAQGFDILVLSAQALEAHALTIETAATVIGSTGTSPQQSPLSAWSIPEGVFQAIKAGEVAKIID